MHSNRSRSVLFRSKWEEGIMKGLEEMLGVMSMFMILMGDNFTDENVSKCVKLHTLNIYNLLYVHYTSANLFLKLDTKKGQLLDVRKSRLLKLEKLWQYSEV